MTTNIFRLVALAVFSGLSMNMILQLGLGVKETAMARRDSDMHIGIKGLLAGSAVLFVAVMLLWLIFSFFCSFLFLGLFEYIVLFPVSALTFLLLEYCARNFLFKKFVQQGEKILFAEPAAGSLASSTPERRSADSPPVSFTGGALTGASLFITLNVAGNLPEAAVLSLGFSCGMALAVVIAGEIRRRSQMELVPEWLRGGPLVVIALGLLALLFSSGALMLFQVLGV